MGKTISFGIQKGGCGKTTVTAMVATILSRIGFKVLAVDYDSQGNLTQFLTQRDPYDFTKKTVFEACKALDARPYIHEINENLSILTAEDFLAGLNSWIYTEYAAQLQREGNTDKYAPSKILMKTLETVKDEYDFILVDLPPNLGELTINGMAASDYAVVILQAEPFCKSSLERYLETLQHTINVINPDTRLLGILTAMIDSRYLMSQHILETTREEYGELVFDTIIRRKARVLEYTFEGISNWNYKADREAQQMYISLVDEILKRGGYPNGIEAGSLEENFRK
ncbi:ParA family protein (plasmid) [Paenibacillus sp. EC2-1]|uniref:ParA family protein n=1 Tax=Paenibacillus sp. EC2-1 TaxID=3388665 RepID=UPI003BEEBE8A